MKKFRTILCAVAAAGTLAACASGKGQFSTEIVGDGEGLTVNADGAGKGTAAGTSIDVLEGEHLRVTASVTSGAIQLTVTGADNSEPSVDYTFTENGQEVEYDVAPGSYQILYSAAEKNTTGTVTTVRVAAADAAEGDGQNPVMNFAGTYAMDRCAIEVTSSGKDGAVFHINWGSSASEHTEWDMSGTFDPDTLTVAYSDAVKRDVVFKEDGTAESDTVIYSDGTGTFTFNDKDNTLVWKDEKEHAADDMVFGFAN